MKKAFLDASSAILLFKANLVEQLFETYHVFITKSVYEELTREDYPGAKSFKEYKKNGSLTICTTICTRLESGYSNISFLDQGEKDTILFYINNPEDFIITDDGQAARYCHDNGIPFINALLFPRILFLTSTLSANTYNRKSQKIIAIGRYSHQIIDFAQNCSLHDLTPFLP